VLLVESQHGFKVDARQNIPVDNQQGILGRVH
jgi:hypothetical protein